MKKKYLLAVASALSWAVSAISAVFVIGILGKLLLLFVFEGTTGMRLWIENLSKSDSAWATLNLVLGLGFLGVLSGAGLILSRQLNRRLVVANLQDQFEILLARCEPIVDSMIVNPAGAREVLVKLRNRFNVEASNYACRPILLDVPNAYLRILERQVPEQAGEELKSVRRTWLSEMRYPAEPFSKAP